MSERDEENEREAEMELERATAVATLPEAEHRAGLGWLLANSALCRQLVKALENDPKKLPAPALMPSARHDRGGKVDAFRWN
ncbi:hypothetical protein T4D_506 [Trichinella pseudospiralis]|uniref:Uncharacterized protein n=1 Tax=Trichinella pseudospiralis TaxID=6337 RepID=A0A0V1F881_TRIPS|nr:hypothetical protein T4D_506 [Trichinella pseudospiralis]